jgi:predicted ATPase/DNA-binding CsgD family transcriptional regulator
MKITASPDRGASKPSSGLPIPLTSFVGRTDELELARSLLDGPEHRLLTLTGPGGIGKTRLAIEIASRIAADIPDGVCFVSLAAVQHHTMVMPAVASALGLRELDIEMAPDAMVSLIGSSRRLLVLDNFEHVLDAAPNLTRLLSQCPDLKIIATSRSLLRVEGEQAIPVPVLALPNPDAGLTPDEWLRVPVVRLFIERARAIDPAHTWDRNDVAQVVEICGRLDGLPLAVELAATRVRHLTLAEIRERLDERLPLLIGGSRDHPDRLQTMRGAIAWSHDLLSPGDQVLFRRLAVFRGGFTLESIEGISRQLDPQVDGSTSSMRDRLSTLIDASLLVREIDSTTQTARYRMLETIREFASEQLARSSESESAQSAHASYFTRFAEAYEFADLLPAGALAIERLEVERANLRAALTWLDQSCDIEHFIRLVAAHGNFWSAQANYREARGWFERALCVSAGRPSAHRAKILVLLGMTELFQGERQEAEARFAEGLAACRDQGEHYYSALALIGLAGVAVLRGEGERSTELLNECRLVASQIPDRRLAELVSGMVSINLAVVSRAAGLLDLAASQIADMLRRSRAEDYLQGTLLALYDLGDLARDRNEWGQALAFYKEALVLGRAQPVKRVLIEVIESVAIVASQTGQFDQSATLLGAAERLRERTGLRYRQLENSSSLEMAIAAIRTPLSAERFAEAWEAGRNLSPDDVIAAALDVQEGVAPPTTPRLTARETEVVRLLVQGMTDPEIATELFISVRTVENHVAHILTKLDVRTRTAAASAAIAAGLVPGATRSPA